MIDHTPPRVGMFADKFELSPDDELRLGFTDLSEGGEATELLRALPASVRAAIAHFSFQGPVMPVDQVLHVATLVENIDRIDPDRRYAGALALSLGEVEFSRDMVQAVTEHDRLPAVDSIIDETHLGDDDWREGWIVWETEDWREIAGAALDVIDLMRRHLQAPNPETEHTYQRANLEFYKEYIAPLIGKLEADIAGAVD